MKCPKCNVNLEEMEVGGITFDFCATSCKGVWLDHGELAGVIAGDEDLPLIDENECQSKPTNMSCPSCSGGRLVEIPYDPRYSVMVDYCEGCKGIWLDFKELGNIKKLVSDALKSDDMFRQHIKSRIK